MLRAMQVRVRASLVVKGRRRFIDWVIEVDTVRGWRDLRAFRDIDQCRAFLVALLVAPDPLRGCTESEHHPSHAPLSLRPVRYAGDPALCAHI
jgi:hypothetical protein